MKKCYAPHGESCNVNIIQWNKLFLCILQREKIYLWYPYTLHFLSQQIQREKAILGVTMAILQSILKINFFLCLYWNKRFLEVFRYWTLYWLYDGHHLRHARRGDNKKLIFRVKIFLCKKKFFQIYMHQRFFLYVLVVFSFFYDVDMEKISR